MQADGITLGVDHERAVAVLTNRKFGFEDLATGGLDAALLYRAVLARKIHQRARPARRRAVLSRIASKLA